MFSEQALSQHQTMIERARIGAPEQRSFVARGTQRVAHPLLLARRLKLRVLPCMPCRWVIQVLRKLLPRPSEREFFRVWLEVRGLALPRRQVPFCRRNEERAPIVRPCERVAELFGSLSIFKPRQARALSASLVGIGAAGRLQKRVSVEEIAFADTGMVPQVGAIDGQPSATGSVLESIRGLVQSVRGMVEEIGQREGAIEGQRP